MDLHLFMFPFSHLKTKGDSLPEDQRKAYVLQTQKAYTRALDYAKGKILCIFRASPLDVILEEEREMYEHIRSRWHNGRLHISPDMNERDFSDRKQNLAIEEFLQRNFPRSQGRAVAGVKLFGDHFTLLPEYAAIFCRDFRIKTNPSIYVPGCQTHSRDLCRVIEMYPSTDYILG